MIILWFVMQLKHILLFLSLGPLRISHRYHPYPPHWESNQRIATHPQTLGEKIKKRRIELHMFQQEAASRIGVSIASLSKWECGVTKPSSRMTKSIQEFLTDITPQVSKRPPFCCRICGISGDSKQRCLFEENCKQVQDNEMTL
jgi:DNA-binding XRE family transcriptional regulator